MPLAEQQKPLDDVTPKEVSGKEVLKNLGELLSNEESRKRILSGILGKGDKRPTNWARTSNPPYYRERFALELQKHLDGMIADSEDIIFRYEDFTWLNKNSLYLMINQAFRYLVDHLDPDGKYRAFHELLSITRDKDKNGNPRGVRISIVRDIRSGSFMLKATKISCVKEDEWRNEMENFIEEAPEDTVFVKDKLSLTPEEIHELEIFLAEFPNILSNISTYQIKLVKKTIPL